MILGSIVLFTLIGGVLSVLLAASVSLTVLTRYADRLVSFAVGVLLATALTSILPEVAEHGVGMAEIGGLVLAGILVFFALEKATLWRHHHSHEGHEPRVRPAAAMIVIGDGLHNFVDGVLIAAAFLTDWKLGATAAIAVLLHEIPQEIGDFMVLLDAGLSRARALWLNGASGAAMVVGGVLGYFFLDNASAATPYVLAFAAASFIYIAVADLVPELHRTWQPRQAVVQLLLIGAGIVTVYALGFLHADAH